MRSDWLRRADGHDDQVPRAARASATNVLFNYSNIDLFHRFVRARVDHIVIFTPRFIEPMLFGLGSQCFPAYLMRAHLVAGAALHTLTSRPGPTRASPIIIPLSRWHLSHSIRPN